MTGLVVSVIIFFIAISVIMIYTIWSIKKATVAKIKELEDQLSEKHQRVHCLIVEGEDVKTSNRH